MLQSVGYTKSFYATSLGPIRFWGVWGNDHRSETFYLSEMYHTFWLYGSMSTSVTRLGDLLNFGHVFKAFGNI